MARCYKCQRFGHLVKYCNGEKSGCSLCAGEHYLLQNCLEKQRKKEKVGCINFRRRKRVETKLDAGCPMFENAAKRQNERIN